MVVLFIGSSFRLSGRKIGAYLCKYSPMPKTSVRFELAGVGLTTKSNGNYCDAPRSNVEPLSGRLIAVVCFSHFRTLIRHRRDSFSSRRAIRTTAIVRCVRAIPASSGSPDPTRSSTANTMAIFTGIQMSGCRSCLDGFNPDQTLVAMPDPNARPVQRAKARRQCR